MTHRLPLAPLSPCPSPRGAKIRHRSGPRVLGVTLVAGLALVVAAAGCGDGPPPVPAAGSPLQGTTTAPRVGTGRPQEPPLSPAEEAKRKLESDMRRTEEMRKDYDRQAHAHMDRFNALAYDPSRDSGLRVAAGTIDVVVDGKKGQYRFTFDASIPDQQKQVGLETVREDPGIHAESAKQAKRFAVLAVRGPCSFVISHSPPILWHVIRSEDDRMIVVAPPHKSALSVSYRMDLKGLVEMRGSSTGKAVSRTAFTWVPRDGTSLLTTAVDDDGKSVISYEYADEKGISALRTATIASGSHVYAATLTWERIETR